MRNRLKMNLFRMKQNKTTYVLGAVSFGFSLLMLGLEWLIEALIGSGMPASQEVNGFGTAISLMTTPFVPMFVLMFALLFFNSEISGGYIKNLVGYQGNKYACAGANLLTVALYGGILLLITAPLGIVLALLCYENTVFTDFWKFAAYLLIFFLESMAYILLFLAWSDRSGKYILNMILGVVYLIYGPILYQLVDLGVAYFFDKNITLAKYTLLGGMSVLNMNSTAGDFLRSGLIAAAVFVLAYFLDVLALKKRELK